MNEVGKEQKLSERNILMEIWDSKKFGVHNTRNVFMFPIFLNVANYRKFKISYFFTCTLIVLNCSLVAAIF